MNEMNQIHPTAIIDPGAILGADIQVGPYAVIEGDVEIGHGCIIAAHSVIKRYTRLGERNTIHEHAVLGGLPQDLGFKDCSTYVKLGDENVIREGVTVHRSIYENKSTILGDNNYLMAYSHVAHDCILGNQVIIANNAQLAGHVEVGDCAFISGLVGIHQFCRIGKLAMIGHNSKITQDCLPFVTTDGAPARAVGLNNVGLKRAGFTVEERKKLKKAYRTLLRSGLPLKDAIEEVGETSSEYVGELIEFMRSSRRGFVHSSKS
jgi:UDP-N-acetylglucosamine acyltransferase